MLEYKYSKETSDVNTICHYYYDDNGDIKAICVHKDVNIHDALQMLMDINDNDSIPLGLS
jgi:hypothetical protein